MKPQMMPSRLKTVMSRIKWSHQHSLKLLRTFLSENSMASKDIEANMSSLKSLRMRVLENQPRKWPRANTSRLFSIR